MSEENNSIYDKSPSMTSEKVDRTSTLDKPGMIYDRSLNKDASEDSTYRKNYPGADETVFIEREVDSVMYPNTDPGRVSVRRGEAVFHIMEAVCKASEKGDGDFLKTLGHYEGFLESISEEIEPKTLEQIRSFFSEGKNVKAEGREDFLKRVLNFVKTVSYGEY